MKKYSAYLFDMDGTLVDSEKLKGKALVQTCSQFGGITDVDTYKAVMGKSWEEVAAHFFSVTNINPAIEEFNSKFKPIYKEILFRELSTNSGAINLLSDLKNQGKKIGVVSSAFSWMVKQILLQLELSKFFDIVITQEDVTKHKPDPEAYLLALKEFSLPASKVLVFEDSHSGILAANKAGCDTIAFQHDFNLRHDFSLAKKIISDFKEYH
jgi:HAD superfamily hydrolase (TIGR01509 family)